ncbi:L-type lectin-domain containing receptor kinase IV.1-like [Macadamia integrifolia]|uniref:L-type lectin-domain containing receptor kinase IV.1-like n=1 Tax=Macadamia integrifolia TaxID=60698 RepID=UPI001C4F25DB|nr:L-type lectin-domain containing receptor kinase IV.1-like [Macadamia integrifolia]
MKWWQTIFFFKYSLLLNLHIRFVETLQEDVAFTYNGFQGVDLSLGGIANITDNGLLTLANTSSQEMGHAFYPHLIHLRNSSTGTALSFSTTFVFAMFSELTTTGGPGIMFVIVPSQEFPEALPNYYFGIFNMTNLGLSSNHVIGFELDTIQMENFNDINGNHVSIDINDLKSVEAAPASYISDQENQYLNLSLISGQPMQLWVEYDGTKKQLKTGKANPSVDVFAFGAFLLEVACGRRPIEPQASEDCIVLVECVVSSWSRGEILETVDPKLEMNYVVEEMELVLRLGLLCSHSIPPARPSMRQVVRYLEREILLPTFLSFSRDFFVSLEYTRNAMNQFSSIAESQLSGGR